MKNERRGAVNMGAIWGNPSTVMSNTQYTLQYQFVCTVCRQPHTTIKRRLNYKNLQEAENGHG